MLSDTSFDIKLNNKKSPIFDSSLYPDKSISENLQNALDDYYAKQERAARKKEKIEPLGKGAKLVGVTRKKNASYSDFRLLAVAQKIAKHYNIKNTRGNNHRIRNCHACRSYQAENINLKISTDAKKSKASLSGLQTCGSVWGCPVCGSRIRIERAKEIKKAIAWADTEKHTPIMLTVTASHHYKTRLSEFKKQFKIAWRKFAQSSVWRRLKKALGIQYTIKATEITRTYENGWHYHYHGLLFVPNFALMMLDDNELETWKNDVAEQWIKCLEAAGLSGKLPYACNIVSHGGAGAEYLTKLGLEDDTANLEHELTSGKNKNYKGRNIWHILRKASEGVKEDAEAYAEYLEAMQGEFFIFWSRGFKKLVGADDITDEEIVSKDDEKPMFEDFMKITDYQYSFVRKRYAYAELLEVAAVTRDKSKVLEFLDGLKSLYVKKQREPDILRLERQYLALRKECFEYAADLKEHSRSKVRIKALEKLILKRDGVKSYLFQLKKDPDLVAF